MNKSSVLIVLSALVLAGTAVYRIYAHWPVRHVTAADNMIVDELDFLQEPLANEVIDACLVLNHLEDNLLSHEVAEFSVIYTLDKERYEDLNFIGRIQIPKIGVDYPIVDSCDLIDISICKFWGVDIHNNGNISLSGHNNKNKTMFGGLSSMLIGDEVFLVDSSGLSVKYYVEDIFTVEPSEVWVAEIRQTEFPEITLITCSSNGKQRNIYKLSARPFVL